MRATYRGIAYEVQVGLGKHRWTWTVHTPKPRHGDCLGSRDLAIYQAQKAIETWCRQNPELCEPRADKVSTS